MTKTTDLFVAFSRLGGLVLLAMFPSAALLAQVHVSNPWSLPLPPTAVNGAAYLTLMNHGADPVSLTGASTEQADRVEIHAHVHDNGQMSMKHLLELTLEPGDSTVFAPGGLHLMLLGLTQPLVAGEQFPLTLEFDGAQIQTVEVLIGEQRPSDEAHKGHHSGNHNMD